MKEKEDIVFDVLESTGNFNVKRDTNAVKVEQNTSDDYNIMEIKKSEMPLKQKTMQNTKLLDSPKI